MCRRRRGGCRVPDWLRDYEARTCSILAIISFSCAVTSFAVFTDSAVLSLTMPLKPAVCTVMSAEDLYGLTKCQWTSCRGSCTAVFYNCTQIKVFYVLSENLTSNTYFPDLLDSVDNANTSTIDEKFSEIVTQGDIHNKTYNNSELLNNYKYTKLNDEEKKIRHNNTSNNLNNSVAVERSMDDSMFLVNNSTEFNGNYYQNVTFKYSFVANSSNETESASSVESVSSSDFQNGNLINEYLKEFEGAELVNVNYNISVNITSVVPLYVNIFGCGYEPEELCEQFFANYTHVGLEFQCLIGFEKEVFAVPNPEEYDFTKFKDPMRSLLLSLIPSGICVLSASYIRIRRLYRMKPKDIETAEPKGRRRLPVKKYPADEKENKLLTNLESRSSPKVSVHKNGQDHLPAFIKVQMPLPPPVSEPSQNIDREQFL